MNHLVVYGKSGVIIASSRERETEDFIFDWGMRIKGEDDAVTYGREQVKLLCINSGDFATTELARNRLKIMDFGGNIIDKDIIDAIAHARGDRKVEIGIAMFTDASVTTYTIDPADGSVRVITDIYPETGNSVVSFGDVDTEGMHDASFEEVSALLYNTDDLVVSGWYEFK